jgi:hypothetical protein
LQLARLLTALLPEHSNYAFMRLAKMSCMEPVRLQAMATWSYSAAAKCSTSNTPSIIPTLRQDQSCQPIRLDGRHYAAWPTIAVACDDAADVDSRYQKLGELGYRQYKEPGTLSGASGAPSCSTPTEAT